MSTLKINTITDVAGSGGPTLTYGATLGTAPFAAPSGSAPIYACRAWVNFNGTGTVAIRASGNVTSITDNGTGDYTVNFTNALPDANYAVNVTSSAMQNGVYGKFANIVGVTGRNTAPSTTAIRVFSGYTSGTLDEDYLCISVFR